MKPRDRMSTTLGSLSSPAQKFNWFISSSGSKEGTERVHLIMDSHGPRGQPPPFPRNWKRDRGRGREAWPLAEALRPGVQVDAGYLADNRTFPDSLYFKMSKSLSYMTKATLSRKPCNDLILPSEKHLNGQVMLGQPIMSHIPFSLAQGFVVTPYIRGSDLII